jgi:hypothetical protein
MSIVKKDKTNMGFFQFLGIAKWIVSFSFKMAPFDTAAFFVFQTIANLDQIINPYIFRQTFRQRYKENIHLGKSEEKLDINQMIKATQSANADEFIKNIRKDTNQFLARNMPAESG